MEAEPTPESPWGDSAHDRVRRRGQQQTSAETDEQHARDEAHVGRRRASRRPSSTQPAPMAASPPATVSRDSDEAGQDTGTRARSRRAGTATGRILTPACEG